MDLALGVIYAGFHFWSYGGKSILNNEITPSLLLSQPAEIRLIIYNFVFGDPLAQASPAEFLRPLLVCRQIHEEAFPIAFQRANFVLCIKNLDRGSASSPPPFWTPQILTLSFSKLEFVRNIVVLWDGDYLDVSDLRRFFDELGHGPLKLSRLTFAIRSPQSRAPFSYTYRYAPMMPDVTSFGDFVMEELPLLENVKSVVFPSPGIESKRNFQLLFDPRKPKMTIKDGLRVRKNLGDWKYTVVRRGSVTDWTLELTHPQKGGEDWLRRESRSEESEQLPGAVSP